MENSGPGSGSNINGGDSGLTGGNSYVEFNGAISGTMFEPAAIPEVSTDSNITSVNNYNINCDIVGSVVLLVPLIILIWRKKCRTAPEIPPTPIDTSEAPIARAMNINFRNPPGRFTKLKRLFKCC